MIQPSKEFRATRHARFEKFLETDRKARAGTDSAIDVNSAWRAWQAAEAECCNAFYDAGSKVPNA